MKQALFVLSGVAIGLLSAFVAFGCCRTEFIGQAEAQAGPAGGNGAGGPQVILATGGATPNQNDLCWVFRQEKGKGAFGSFRVIGEGEQDAEWDELIASHDRPAQEAALKNPEYADRDTADLMEFYMGEVQRRAA